MNAAGGTMFWGCKQKLACEGSREGRVPVGGVLNWPRFLSEKLPAEHLNRLGTDSLLVRIDKTTRNLV